MKITYQKHSGFSLVEMAVVVVLIGVLMTFGIKLATSFQDRSGFTATKNKQILLKEALISFLAQKGRLPCPASISTPPTGIENIVASTAECSSNPGLIPYDTLGIPKDTAIDGWDRLFIYEVSTDATSVNCNNWVNVSRFNTSPSPSPRPSVGPELNKPQTHHDGESGCINIEEDTDGNGTVDNSRIDRVAVIVSNGPNGEGGFTDKGVQTEYDVTVTNDSKETNNIIGPSKAAHIYRIAPPTLSGFDDVVMELSASDILQPLKRDGSIKSINEIAETYFESNISVAPITCTLSYVGVPTPPAPSILRLNVQLNITHNYKVYSKALHSPDYGCPSGFNYG